MYLRAESEKLKANGFQANLSKQISMIGNSL